METRREYILVKLSNAGNFLHSALASVELRTYSAFITFCLVFGITKCIQEDDPLEGLIRISPALAVAAGLGVLALIGQSHPSRRPKPTRPGKIIEFPQNRVRKP